MQRAGGTQDLSTGMKWHRGEGRDAHSLVAVLGQAIDTSGVDELLVPDLFLEETL